MTDSSLEPKREGKSGSLPVNEIFYSVQGEGRWAGHPAVFVRFNYCNLGCSWCDTKFTWEAGKVEAGVEMMPDDITLKLQELISKQSLSPAGIHVVLTGGEPMLHAERLTPLIVAIREAGFNFIEVETNGTIMPTEDLLTNISWWNCSPKLANSGISSQKRIEPDVLRTLDKTNRADFKFVVGSPDDINQIEKEFIPLISREHLFLMPEGETRDEQLSKMGWLLEKCAEHSFRFSPRLQVLAWDNERKR